jgi:hypothetical protein
MKIPSANPTSEDLPSPLGTRDMEPHFAAPGATVPYLLEYKNDLQATGPLDPWNLGPLSLWNARRAGPSLPNRQIIVRIKGRKSVELTLLIMT